MEISSSSGDGVVFQFVEQDAQDEIIDTSHCLSESAFGHSSLIFMESYISTIVQAIFDAPIGTDHLE